MGAWKTFHVPAMRAWKARVLHAFFMGWSTRAVLLDLRTSWTPHVPICLVWQARRTNRWEYCNRPPLLVLLWKIRWFEFMVSGNSLKYRGSEPLSSVIVIGRLYNPSRGFWTVLSIFSTIWRYRYFSFMIQSFRQFWFLIDFQQLVKLSLTPDRHHLRTFSHGMRSESRLTRTKMVLWSFIRNIADTPDTNSKGVLQRRIQNSLFESPNLACLVKLMIRMLMMSLISAIWCGPVRSTGFEIFFLSSPLFY